MAISFLEFMWQVIDTPAGKDFFHSFQLSDYLLICFTFQNVFFFYFILFIFNKIIKFTGSLKYHSFSILGQVMTMYYFLRFLLDVHLINFIGNTFLLFFFISNTWSEDLLIITVRICKIDNYICSMLLWYEMHWPC